MSLPEHNRRMPSRVAAAGLLVAALLLGACTVRPLYSDAPLPSGSSANVELASISVNAVSTRYGQEVRNHLIFLLGNGRGQPAEPRYYMDIGVTSLTESAASVQVATEDEPTAGTVTLRSYFTLRDTGGAVVLTGDRQVMSSYDVPRQEFAALRALRDAENRAARELAELVRLAIAQDLGRPKPAK